MAADSPTVVIVGAGLAGLRCADLLAGKVNLVVVEAQDRVGGRCWSSRGWADAQVAEHGGELIEDGQDHILGLVREMGLELESRSDRDRPGRLVLNGRLRDLSEVTGLPAVLARMQTDLDHIGPLDGWRLSSDARALDDLTAADWVEENVEGGMSSELGALLALALTTNLGLAPHELSALAVHHMFLGLPESGVSSEPFRFGHELPAGDTPAPEFDDLVRAAVTEVFHVRGGNDIVAKIMADRLPGGALHLNSPLASVRMRSDGRYDVDVDGGLGTVVADRVVLTAPLTALRAIDLSRAGLSGRRQRAIAEVPMGRGTKLLLQLEQRPGLSLGWPGHAVVDVPPTVVWDTSAGQEGDAGLLTLFTGDRVFRTDSGAHGEPDAASFARAREIVARVAPGLEQHLTGRGWLDSWPDDPWTGGSYAMFAPGQYSDYCGFLGRPERGVHFAGEHTSISSYGYLDGAVGTGERAASEVSAALGLTPAGR